MESENIFGMRLLAARKQAGLSQDDLVILLDRKISKTAIARYERGIMEPRPEYVQLLANALKQSMDYFYRPMTTKISDIKFRKNASLGVKRETMIREKIAAFTERYIILENILGVQTTFEKPLKNNLVSGMEDVELLAEQLHVEWDLGFNPLGPIMCLLEEKGIKVLELESADKFQGYSAMIHKTTPFIILRKEDTAERRRLTALHELAHIVLNFHPDLSESETEKLCNAFAGAVLIPRRTYNREIGAQRTDFSKRELSIIKDRYGISASAFIMRSVNLGVLPKYKMINLLNYARKDKLEKHIGTNQLTDHPDRFDQLISIAISEGRISLTKAAELAQIDLDSLMKNYVNND
jgi:Zn-dependent peptidase ImmA (M78 family)